MAIQDDFTITYSTKKIAHTAGTTRYTVNALYSYVQDLFDELGQLDDDVPMKANTPTEYELINGWTFNADSDLGYLYGGSIKVNTPNDLWANFYTIGSIDADSVVYWLQNGALVASHPGYTQGHIDQLIKVTASGVDVDAKNVTALIRGSTADFGRKFDHFKVTAPATGGRNPVPLSVADDLNDNPTVKNFATTDVNTTTDVITITSHGFVNNDVLSLTTTGTAPAGLSVNTPYYVVTAAANTFQLSATQGGAAIDITSQGTGTHTVTLTVSGITITGGTVSKTLGGVTKNYDVTIACGGNLLADVYKRLKFLTRRDQTTAPGGGTGLVSTTEGRFYTLAVGGYTEVKESPFGTFAGGILFGARGIWIENMHGNDVKNYQLIAADGTVVNPPNVVSVTVDSIVSGDRIFVAKTSAGALVRNEYALTTGNNAGGTSIVLSGSIGSDKPAAGFVRISIDVNTEHRYEYSSWATTTFTLKSIPDAAVTTQDTTGITLTATGATFITSGVKPGMRIRNVTDGSTALVVSITSETVLVCTGLTGGTDNRFDVADSVQINKLTQNYTSTTNVYVPLIDDQATGTSLTNTLTYAADVSVITKVRKKGILPFEVAGTVSSTGLKVTAIRTTDTVVV